MVANGFVMAAEINVQASSYSYNDVHVQSREDVAVVLHSDLICP